MPGKVLTTNNGAALYAGVCAVSGHDLAAICEKVLFLGRYCVLFIVNR